MEKMEGDRLDFGLEVGKIWQVLGLALIGVGRGGLLELEMAALLPFLLAVELFPLADLSPLEDGKTFLPEWIPRDAALLLYVLLKQGGIPSVQIVPQAVLRVFES
jgi:hypothetical protein